MTINTDITNPELTRFAKYLFFIEQGLYFPMEIQEAMQKLEPTLSETFNTVNVYIDDENIKDYDVTEEAKKEEPYFLYFITCDTRNPRFKRQLEVIKDHNRFVDCYQYQSKDSNVAVIRYKVTVKQRVIKLLESNYSEMYQERERNAIVNNRAVQSIYTYWNPDNKMDEFDDSIHILLRSSEMFDRMIDRLGLTDTDTIKQLEKQEFDSKYSITEETLRFTNELVYE